MICGECGTATFYHRITPWEYFDDEEIEHKEG
jgi:hypothetical protein